ncbi:hypothetical protein [Massilia yuzhufengensis]|uniref:hypothetical protein n=1 Tax=Massilia yuzhufengensis TaxID=1164594 RepID=UPI001160BCEE|nr:hypothetical protein [Massilia yuzhufengensis]
MTNGKKSLAGESRVKTSKAARVPGVKTVKQIDSKGSFDLEAIKKGLPSQHQRLLDRQQNILRTIRARNLASGTDTVKLSPAKIQEIAHDVGIWTGTGKLAAAYKK